MDGGSLAATEQIATGFENRPLAYVAALAVVACVVQFVILVRQHKAQLKDRDEQGDEVKRILEERARKAETNAERLLVPLERMHVMVSVLERSIEALASHSKRPPK